MSTKQTKPQTLEEILQEGAPTKPTRLGKMAMGTAATKRGSLRQKKNTAPDYTYSVSNLEALRAESDKPYRRQKGKDVLERTPKEIVELALGELCAIYFQATGYNPHWVRAVVEDDWQSGRPLRHSFDKRIRCCQLIHFLETKGITQRQAMAVVDRAYDFNKTDAKDSYYFFRRDLNKYYFPEIQFKAHIAIRIVLDLVRYGKIKLLIAPPINTKTVDKFKEIIAETLVLFSKEIEFAKKEKLEKSGIEINPILKEFVGKNSDDLMKRIQADEKLAHQFAIYGTRFLNELEFYYEFK